MEQSLNWPVFTDPIYEGQTVEFRIQGVSFLIYGRVVSPTFIKDGFSYSRVKTFVDCEEMDIRHDDMVRKVMSRKELYAIITQYSPERWA